MMNRSRSRMSRSSRKQQSSYTAAQRVNFNSGSYIVAQTPKAATAVEWLRMIWQQNVHIVVSLCEIGRKEGNSYEWFDLKPGNKKKTKNRFLIRTVVVTSLSSAVHYELRLRDSVGEESGEERHLHVIIYQLWQDVSVENSTETTHILQRLYTLAASLPAETDSPILVHGGRTAKQTGSFVLMCMICKQLREYGVSSLMACINLVRKYKNGVIADREMLVVVLHGILQFVIEDGLATKKQRVYEQALKVVQECSTPKRKANVYL